MPGKKFNAKAAVQANEELHRPKPAPPRTTHVRATEVVDEYAKVVGVENVAGIANRVLECALSVKKIKGLPGIPEDVCSVKERLQKLLHHNSEPLRYLMRVNMRAGQVALNKYGKVGNVGAGMVFLEDCAGILHWKIYRGVSVRSLGARTGGGSRQDAAAPAVTLFCPFWVKHRRGQEEKVFLVLFLYIRPPSSHTWALMCTQDELGQLQKFRGVPLSEIGGVLPGTREVGGAAQTAALTARLDPFQLRWGSVPEGRG